MSEEHMEAKGPQTDDDLGGADTAPTLDVPKRIVWPWVVLGVLVALLLLVGWTKVVNSDSYCAKCHSMQTATDSAAHSVHSEVTCLTCHQGQGVLGAVRYIPSLFREGIDQLTPIPLARGIMDAAPCEDCHEVIFTSPLLQGEHPSSGCEECHGNTTHPVESQAEPLQEDTPHTVGYVQLHGRDADQNLETCTTCHGDSTSQRGFCMTCHFKSGAPHPTDWIPTHGAVQEEAGPDACTLCHDPTFCASCHGTQIPHPDDWVQNHPTEVVQKQNQEQCTMCHVQTDCNYCHVKHYIHPGQGLYFPDKQR